MQFGSLSSINKDFQKRVNLHLFSASCCRKNWNTASISLDAHIAHSTLGFRFTFTITSFKNICYQPPSLSRPSPHCVSSLVAQSAPSQPASHWQRHSPEKDDRHAPWPEHVVGQPWMVQCRPFQPVTQRHVPFLHWPCSEHLTRGHVVIISS